MGTPTYTLTLHCPDKAGIVAAVCAFIAAHGGSVIEANHFSDLEKRRFFLRQVIDANTLNISIEAFREQFAPIAAQFAMDWRLHDGRVKRRMVIFVSKQDHCLAELLYRWRSGDYNADIVGVISNHEALRPFVEWHGIPYHVIPVSAATKARDFEKIGELTRELNPDLIVLARYMQIMPEPLCEQFFGRMINIHHSFLPSFQGAKPYHQAYARGVKLIGATCHYVTAELDEGPIIEQEVIRVSHNQTADDLVKIGRDVEKLVLSRSVQYALESRVLLNGTKTVVFR